MKRFLISLVVLCAASACWAAPPAVLLVINHTEHSAHLFLQEVNDASAPHYVGRVRPRQRLQVPVPRGHYWLSGYRAGDETPEFGPERILVQRRTAFHLLP